MAKKRAKRVKDKWEPIPSYGGRNENDKGMAKRQESKEQQRTARTRAKRKK